MTVQQWKPGQTRRWEDEWATVSFVLPGNREIITTDDGVQALVPFDQLKNPLVQVHPMHHGRFKGSHTGALITLPMDSQ